MSDVSYKVKLKSNKGWTVFCTIWPPHQVHYLYICIYYYKLHYVEYFCQDVLTSFHVLVFFFLLQTFNELFNSQRTEADILSIVSKAEEFDQLKVRNPFYNLTLHLFCINKWCIKCVFVGPGRGDGGARPDVV